MASELNSDRFIKLSLDNFEASLALDLKTFYMRGKFCDISIWDRTCRKSVLAHRVVLATRMPYFYEEIERSMRSVFTGYFEYRSSLDSVILEKLVQFCYTGQMSVSDTEILTIIEIAKNWRISELLDICSRRGFINRLPILSMHNALSAMQKKQSHISRGHHIVLFRIDDRDGEAIIEAMLPEIGEWKTISTSKEMLNRIGASYLLLGDDKIIISGGWDNNALTEVHCLCMKTMQFEVFPPMQERRSFHASVAINNAVYVVGGSSKRGKVVCSAERFSHSDMAWSMICPMKSRRSDFCLVAVNQHLYAIGGSNGYKALHSMERYSIASDLWDVVTPMKKARSAFGAVVEKNFIYVLDSDGTVEQYDTLSDSWATIITIDKFKLRRGSTIVMCPWEQYLCAFDDVSVRMYNKEDQKWVRGANINKKGQRKISFVASDDFNSFIEAKEC